ncbi:GNAT family N-acetyltransferase [Paracoccus contaminans]|uniref:GNAT family N-acetyltransferase n=2 Tax=Paracoccus contaminans TaxID=1945662 RepID=A0A1W6D1B7_9RHOB|nr:GNAT family N-acetyltransferase [Paracoccus contaminans]
MAITIAPERPDQDDLDRLFDRHSAFCHADTPPESIHMMDRAALAAEGIEFHVMRQDGLAIGMGAIKRIGAHEGEIKSMHVLNDERGRGLGRRMVDHLIAAARAQGMTRLSLETGAQDSFAPARMLYAAAGFVPCEPFGDYRPDPMSVFMTLPLAQA